MEVINLREFTFRAAQNQPVQLADPVAGATMRGTPALPLMEVFKGAERVGFIAPEPMSSNTATKLNFHRCPENNSFAGAERVVTGLVRHLTA